MIRWIIKKIIKDYTATSNKRVREAYGRLAGALGIGCNLLLFVMKLVIGIKMNSIAILADAFNNLTDLGSSTVSLLAIQISNRPPDKEHPHGHGRFEYISTLVVSFIIFGFGFSLLSNALQKIGSPEPISFDPVGLTILLISVLVKLWMFSYNRYIGKTIGSNVYRAAAADSLNDVLATLTVVAAMVFGSSTTAPLDGIIGVGISAFILWTGFTIAKDTVNVLLGSSPSPELVRDIRALIPKDQYIWGTHDLVVHDYGPGRVLASIHVEVPDTANIVEIHSVIDDLERKISKQLGIEIVIHVDPVCTHTEIVDRVYAHLCEIAGKIDPSLSIEHLRVIRGRSRSSIRFSLGYPAGLPPFKMEETIRRLREDLQKDNQNSEYVIDDTNL